MSDRVTIAVAGGFGAVGYAFGRYYAQHEMKRLRSKGAQMIHGLVAAAFGMPIFGAFTAGLTGLDEFSHTVICVPSMIGGFLGIFGNLPPINGTTAPGTSEESQKARACDESAQPGGTLPAALLAEQEMKRRRMALALEMQRRTEPRNDIPPQTQPKPMEAILGKMAEPLVNEKAESANEGSIRDERAQLPCSRGSRGTGNDAAAGGHGTRFRKKRGL